MPFRLIHEGEATEIVGEIAIIGRSRTCDLQLLHTEVSREHARIRCTGDEAVIEDLESANGLFINGQPVAGSQSLAHKDVITIVEMLVRFEWIGVDAEDGDAPVSLSPSGRRRSHIDDDLRDTSMQSRLEVLCAAATSEIANGALTSAETTIEPALHRVLERAYRSAVERESILLAARFALKLARPSAKVDWPDYVLQLCLASRRPLPRGLGALWVDTVEGDSRPDHLEAYVGMLREMVGARDGDAQAALQLLESLFQPIPRFAGQLS